MRQLSGRSLFLLAVIAGVLWLGYSARAVVTPLLAALLLAYVLDPGVKVLQRRGLSRPLASALVVAIAFVTIVGGSALAATRLYGEAKAFYADVVGEPAVEAATPVDALHLLEAERRAPDGKEWEVRTVAWEGRTLWFVDRDGDGDFRPGYARAGLARVRRDLAEAPFAGKVTDALKSTEDLSAGLAASAGRWLGQVATTASAAGEAVLGVLTLLVLFPIYLYYSLVRLDWVYDVTVRHLPAAHRGRVVDILQKIHLTLSAFFRGRLILLAIKFVALLAILVSFGVPFAGVCAAFAAVASLVPVLGSVAGGAVPVLLALAYGEPTETVLGLVGALLALEVVEQYVLTPAIVGKRVGLHPLTILVATFVAGDLLGIFGMLVAIPLTAVLKILAIEFVLPEVRRNAGMAPEGPAA